MFQTLYIKNLSTKVTEQDLRTIFMRYEVQEGPSIDYRLLTGRMKGQAFVTFPGLLFRGTNVTPFPILWNYFTHPCCFQMLPLVPHLSFSFRCSICDESIEYS